jgi:ABC-type phosphate/phosphonate transport system substrate-binding protein
LNGPEAQESGGERLGSKENARLKELAMKASTIRGLTGAMGLAVVFAGNLAVAAEARSAAAADGLTVVIMDPLALPLSCPCVKGYAQRDYDQLGKFLAQRLKSPVTVVFSETLPGALANKTGGKADLIIGKDSVIRRQAKKAGLGVVHLAALTGLDGKTTQTGLFIVPTKDPALSVTDLKGYRIILGPQDCDEKNLAAQNVFVQSGLPKLHTPETCSACSDGATKILDLYKQGTKSATIISSYAKPLLEGCGTVKKGDLRVIGETEPVPFVAAFANSKLSASTRDALTGALLEVGRDNQLCKALETKFGFVASSDSDLARPVAAKKN